MNNDNTFSTTEYTDLRGNTHKIQQSTIFTQEEKRELEERIADELYRIFTQK